MLNKYNNSILTALILLLVSVSLSVAGPRSKFGLSAAPELLIPVGSIGTSLSGSNISNVTGVEALYWNPSGLATINSKTAEIMFSHQKYIADIDINYFGGAYRLGSLGNVGISIKAMGFGDIEVTTADAPEGTGETFSPNYITAGVTFARAMTDRIMFGVTGKVVYEKIARESATGFAFDFGLQYLVGSTGLKLGVTLKNIGTSMRFDGPDLEGFYQPENTQSGSQNEPRRITLGDFELPTSLALGLSYDLKAGKNNGITFSGIFQNNSYSPDDYAIGMEYNFKKMFFLRGAYNFDQHYFDNSLDPDEKLFGPTFGAGFRYDAGSVIVAFDYAYRHVMKDAFSANQYFTLSVGF